MGDHLRAGILPQYVIKSTRLTQPCIPLESLNLDLVSALIAGWQVTLCDPIWHVSSNSDDACLQTTILSSLYDASRMTGYVLVCLGTGIRESV